MSVVFEHLAYVTLGLQLDEGPSGERRANLEPLGDDRRRDQLVAGHLLVELVVGRLVKEGQVVEFVTHLSLGPFLRRPG